MTRTYTAKPIWTWRCDECGREQYLAREQSGSMGLPSLDEMRLNGWYIADNFGDRCPLCIAEGSASGRKP